MYLQHTIRLISSHDHKVEQKMTSVFLAILFALENEENINDSVNFAGLLRSRKCLMFLSLTKGVCFAFKIDFP